MSTTFPESPRDPDDRGRAIARPPAAAAVAAAPARSDHPLLATKLFAPLPPAGGVPRPRLAALLDAGLGRKLTLVAAPVGFGKTTALAAWRVAASERGVPLAWLSLDAGDNDPIRFWSYVAAALDPLQPGTGHALLSHLRQPQPGPAETFLTALLNALVPLNQDVALVFDDYHAITASAVHDGLSFVLDHLPPRLHLVIASRTDPPLPLARLRARGDLAEVRAADLRFTAAETGAYFRDTRGLPLAAAEIDALGGRTEGWIAALHLAALALEGQADPAGIVRDFAGSHRFIVDYLAEEVLGRQPAATQAFLLETALLDRLCAPLCEAVTGRDDGQSTLEQLERANLFTVSLDHERRWYRYHHLFAEFLRARLVRTQLAAIVPLHQRAAAWFEGAGLIPEAVGHALAGADVACAARLVEHAAEPMWTRGELSTLLGWLEALPRDAVRARPRLALAHAAAHFLARSYDAPAVAALLAEAEAALFATPSPAANGGERVQSDDADLWGILAAIRAAAATTAEDAPEAIASARLALASRPAGPDFWRIVATVSLGLGLDTAGETAAAGRALEAAAALCRDGGNRYLGVVATMNLARVRAAEGRLRAASDLCREGLALAGEHPDQGIPVAGYLHVQLGKLAYERNDLAMAERHLTKGIAHVRAVDEQLRILIEGYAALARIRRAQGDDFGTNDMLQRCQQVALASRLSWAVPLAAAYRARLAIQRGDLAAADEWVNETALGADDEVSYAREFAHLTFVRLLIARGDTDAALRLLDRLAAAAAAASRHGTVLETLVLRALANNRLGAVPEALTVLGQLLALAEAERYVRVFVDEGGALANLLRCLEADWSEPHQDSVPDTTRAHLGRLLAAFPLGPATSPAGRGRTTAAAPVASPLPEPLTGREREILALIAAGLSNAEIADRLYIGVATVKSHVNAIFAKLPATSRTQAVARARDRGLLTS